MRWNPFRRDVPVAVAEVGPDQYFDSAANLESGIGSAPVKPAPFIPVATAATDWLTRLIRGLLIVLIVLLPVFVLPFTTPGDVLVNSKQLLLYGADIVLLVLWLILIMRQNGVVLKRSRLEWPLLGVLLASGLAAAFSQQPAISFLGGGGFLALTSGLLFYCLILNFFAAEETLALGHWFLLGGALALLLGLAVIFNLPGAHWLSGTLGLTNTVGSANALGALAVLLMVFSLSHRATVPETVPDEAVSEVEAYTLVVRQPVRYWKIIKIATALLAATLLIVINWWVFYLALAIGMLVIIVAPGFVQRATGWKMKFGAVHMLVPLGVLVLALLLIFSSAWFNFNISARNNLPIEVALTQSGSSAIAQGVLLTRPVLGYGQDNFSLAFDRFKANSLNYTQFWSARFPVAVSEWFNRLVEQGILGGLAWLSLFVLLIYYAVGRQIYLESVTHIWLIMPTLVASFALFFLYPYSFTHSFVFWLFVGMAGSALAVPEQSWRIRMDDSSLPSLLSSLVFVLVLVFGLVGGYLLVQKYTGEVYFAKAAKLDLTNPAKQEQAIGLLTNAINANPNNLNYLNNFASLILGRLGQELNNTKDKKAVVQARIQNFSTAAIQAAQRMQANAGNTATAWLDSGLVFENLATVIAGADEAALSAYRRYSQLAPQDPTGPLRAGSIYLARADNIAIAINNAKANKQELKNEKDLTDRIKVDYGKAEASFKQALELKHDLATALYNLGIVYERENRLDDAIKQLELTRTANPSDAGLPFELGLLYYRSGKKDQGIDQLQQAVSLFSDFSNARWYLALMLEEKGDNEGAKAQLRAILALEANQDNQTVKDKLAALEGGKSAATAGKVTNEKPLP